MRGRDERGRYHREGDAPHHVTHRIALVYNQELPFAARAASAVILSS
jgi:hypothetical protein